MGGDGGATTPIGDAATVLPDTSVGPSLATPDLVDARTIAEPLLPAITRPPDGLEPGETLGRYTVLERLGAGGMGVVYAAYDPELDRKVAVKQLHPRLAGSGSMGAMRLLREAKALAKLSHPNVISIHDVGTFGDQVFIAMEFVEGRTLREWAKDETRPWREVLDVLLAAGRGLAAAHAAGMVHRDFKPDNVLVGDDGRVRVLDFGLARDSEARSSGEHADEWTLQSLTSVKSLLTEVGARVGTPPYMAPEQRFAASVTARSDQFAFCVVAWECLLRVHPFPRLFESRDDTVTALYGEPRRPDKRSDLPGAIERVLLRGLSRRVADRFPSMDALLTALTPRQKTNRRWLIASGLIATSMGAGWWIDRSRVATAPTSPCERVGERLAGVWDGGARASIKQQFVASGLGYAEYTFGTIARALDRYTERWTTHYRERCEAAEKATPADAEIARLQMACLEQQRHELAAMTALLSEADASVVKRSVNALTSLPPPERCAKVETIDPYASRPRPPEAREALDDKYRELAALKALVATGKTHEALKRGSEALPEIEALDHCPLTAEWLALIGTARTSNRDFAEAEPELVRAAWTAEACGAVRLAYLTETQLVYNLGQQRRREDGLRWAARAEQTLARIPDANEGDRGLLFAQRGVLHHLHGDATKAEEDLLQSLALQEQALGADAPKLGATLNTLGLLAQSSNRDTLARGYYERCARIIDEAFGPGHPNSALCIANLSHLLSDMSHYAEAKENYDRVIKDLSAEYGEHAPLVDRVRSNQGDVLVNLGRVAEARAMLTEVTERLEKAYGTKEERLVIPLRILANAQSLEGDVDGALATLDKTAEVLTALHGENTCEHSPVAFERGETYQRAGRHAEAVTHYRRSLSLCNKPDGSDPAALACIARSQLALGDTTDARATYDRALVKYVERDYKPTDRAWIRFIGGLLRDAEGDRAAARVEVLAARAVLDAVPNPSHEVTVAVDGWLAVHPG